MGRSEDAKVWANPAARGRALLMVSNRREALGRAGSIRVLDNGRTSAAGRSRAADGVRGARDIWRTRRPEVAAVPDAGAATVNAR